MEVDDENVLCRKETKKFPTRHAFHYGLKDRSKEQQQILDIYQLSHMFVVTRSFNFNHMKGMLLHHFKLQYALGYKQMKKAKTHSTLVVTLLYYILFSFWFLNLVVLQSPF